ncbi:MAG TPA: citrate/2-methylcitrate synthase [Elusimicrobiota bacterium]|jgi:citrate synthase|nr:citrate/2-methylcitrate synthase [Elusimicrobiota bacterium]
MSDADAIIKAATNKPVDYSPGLEDVVAAKSRLCEIDGKAGKLYYCGYSIEDLAQNSSYEEVCYLLWYGRLPRHEELEDLRRIFRETRELPTEVLGFIEHLPHKAHPMDALRTIVSLLATFDLNPENTPEANLKRAIKLTAQIPTIIAAFQRLRMNQKPVAPHEKLGHAANFLYMLSGEEPDEGTAKVMDLSLVLHADHEMNASTFASLVTASTLSDIYSAVTSGIGTLKGSLHGGANESVLKMLQEIGDPNKVEDFVEQSRAKKARIMGFGHRVYKNYDPRARILKEYARRLSAKTKFSRYFQINDELEKVMQDKYGRRGIFPNVDLYSGIVYHHMDIPIDLFTPIFALSRVAGWTAHVLEYWQDNRLFRPAAAYIGSAPREYVPESNR